MTTRPNRRITCLGPRTRLAPALLLSIAMTGCYPAMSTTTPDPDSDSKTDRLSSNMTPPPGHGPFTGTVADWPLWFTGHEFDVSTYSTYGCKVRYGNYRIDEPDDELQSSSESLGSDYPDNMTAGWGPIPNFPASAQVNWRSKDGSPHHAEIDIAEIFRDKLIRHHASREEISETASIPPPGIILEVNDSTINVYMRAWVPMKTAQIPGNKYSYSRNDLIKVFSRTY